VKEGQFSQLNSNMNITYLYLNNRAQPQQATPKVQRAGCLLSDQLQE